MLVAAGGICFAGTLPAAESSVVELEEIVVTAQFREQSLQETPIAITAVTAADLEARAVTSAYEVAYTVPNAAFRPAQAAFGNTMTAFIRGVGQNDFDFAFEPGVGTYIDDVYHPFLMGSSVELLDLERVEVLRGPQGTLFGRGSIGGAVRYITRKPEGDNSGSIGVTVGRYDRVDLRASYDFALTENLFARVTGVSTSRRGHQKVYDFACLYPSQAGNLPVTPPNNETGCKRGTQGGEDVTGARGALRWVGSDRLELNVTGEYMKLNAEPRADTLTAVAPNSWSPADLGVPYDSRFIPPNPFISYATYRDPRTGLAFEPRTRLDKWTLSGRADWQLTDAVSAALILAHTDLSSTLVADNDGSPINIQQTAGVQTIDFSTAELRFSGRAMDRVDWTVGGFYYDGSAANDQQVYIPFFVGNPPVPVPLANTHNVHDNKNISVFGHAIVDLTERLSLTAGLRYSRDEKLVSFDNSIAQFGQDIDGKRTDWRLGLDYRLTDDVMLYTSASTGYRPGGYNPRPFQVTQQVAVGEEESTAYELGVKADLFNNTLRANLAAFYTDWSTRIVPQGGTECWVIPGSNPPTYNTGNPGDPGAVQDSQGNWCVPLTPTGSATTSRTFYVNQPGKVKGAELELAWFPIAGLSFNGSLGLLDWKSPDISDNPNVLSDRPAFVPESNWSVGAAYRFNLSGGATLTPRLDMHGQAKICSANVQATAVFPEASCSDGYELLNGRLQWDSPQREWGVALGVTNLTDKTYFLNKFDLTAFGQPHAEGQPARRREWYASFTRTFN